jgi:uncharacterized membrane protein (DUF373 family)
MQQQERVMHPVRRRVSQALSMVEDVVYIGLGILLAASAVALLVAGYVMLGTGVHSGAFGSQFVALLDRILLILLVVELLYTVQVSFREHGLVAEPFVVVALIAVIRRILVLTAEVAHLPGTEDVVFRHAIIELALLTVMIAVLVMALIALQRQAEQASTTATKPTTGPA